MSIVIVNYNSNEYLVNCLKSIEENLSIGCKVVIVDNHSKNKLDFNDPNIKIISLNENLGFAKANNNGAKNSVSEYICFLNPDTIITEDFVTPIINFINSNKNAGACGPMLNYENGSYQTSSGSRMGFMYEFMEAFMFIGLYRKFKERVYKKKSNDNKPLREGWVSAACLIIKKSVFENVGGFTEDYFLNYEDIDLCRKLEDNGFENYYFPHLRCIHLDHKSFDRNYELLVYSRYQSRLIYSKLHYSMFVGIITQLMHIIGLILRIIFVNFIYSAEERKARSRGYLKSLILYLKLPYR